MTAPTLGKRVRVSLPADLTASLRSAGVTSFVDGAGQRWEWSAFGTRYVRTAAGAKRYGLPIGAPIVGHGRKPKSGGGGKPGGGGGGGKPGGGEGAPPKPAPPKPPEKKPAAKKSPGGVKLTPAQRDAAERHLGREPGAGRGAYLDGNQLVVEDRDAAVKALDKILAGDDLTPGERKARKNLRDKIAATKPDDSGQENGPGGDNKEESSPGATPPESPAPEPAAEPDPASRPEGPPEAPSSPEPPRQLDHDELVADWLNNGPELTDEDRDAIAGYAQSDYHEINSLLRDNVDFPLNEDDEADYRDRTQLLRDVQSRYALPGPANLYRRVPDGVLPPHPMQPGDVFEDKAFMSTSTTQHPGSFSKHPNVMDIDVPKGTPAINVGASALGVAGEREILLPPGTKLRVISDDIVNGERRVKMEAIPL